MTSSCSCIMAGECKKEMAASGRVLGDEIGDLLGGEISLERAVELLGGAEPESPAELIETMRSKLHSIEQLAGALRPFFEVGEPLRGTYLYRWKLDESVQPLEKALVLQGELPPTGVRIVARRLNNRS